MLLPQEDAENVHPHTALCVQKAKLTSLHFLSPKHLLPTQDMIAMRQEMETEEMPSLASHCVVSCIAPSSNP